MKLASKQRIGSKVVKRYHVPETPYQRLLGSTDVPRLAKQQLTATYQDLNPAQLTREIARLQQALWKAVQKKRRKKKTA